MELLERQQPLEALRHHLRAAADGRGRAVTIGGEAGVGKTSLLGAFVDQHQAEARVLWGACDGLSTPRALGPFADMADREGGRLAAALTSDRRPHDVAATVLSELRRGRPTIVVVDDAHWADEASLDVLRLLSRRMDSTVGLLLVSYRDDEVGAEHPLRIALGDIAGFATVHRLALAPLSVDAVRELSRGSGVDAHMLHTLTGGNAFFVTETLATGEHTLPTTVRDAVLARIARLGRQARDLLDAAAVLGAEHEMRVLAAVAGSLDGLDECTERGVLQVRGTVVAFRHELARIVVAEAAPLRRRTALHGRALAALQARVPPADPARLAYHAEQADDRDAALKSALQAAEGAHTAGAHLEAAEQYARALRFADGLPPERLARIYEQRSYACYLTSQFDDAVGAREAALEQWRAIGDRAAEGDNLRWLSRVLWFQGRNEEAERAADEAIARLEPIGPSRELAMAYSNRSQLWMLSSDANRAITTGERAIDLAEQLGDREVLAHALNNVGTSELSHEHPEGLEKLERSLQIAMEDSFEEHVARALTNLATSTVERHLYVPAGRYLRQGIDYCTERDLDSWRLYLLGWRARFDLEQGRWDEAAETAALVLGYTQSPSVWIDQTSPVTRVTALIVAGLVRLRRGEPGAEGPINDAWATARQIGELQRLAPAAAAMAELAWTESRGAEIDDITREPLAVAIERGYGWPAGELALWRWRAGILHEAPARMAAPFALHIAGRFNEAAAAWRALGCPYEEAAALADTGDEASLRRALELFDALGARRAAVKPARKLRTQGAKRVPRGPRKMTRANPQGLTNRELEVLGLVAHGLTNREIAGELVLSPRTVDMHVRNMLGKLQCRSRTEAARRASELGLVAPRDGD